ncbi:HPP family protein [Gemmobacter caeni]|uniref:HPP family protein n=1 Tax=Gemmobacter caeni TaxID=589035 RepID=UPI001315337F|nr:HPP family protein [Gemmobacter caeni]
MCQTRESCESSEEAASSIAQANLESSGIIRAAIGASIAIALVGFLVLLLAIPFPDVIFIPSFGATATLIFMCPGSPYAQPWPAIGGNAMAASIGVLIATAVHIPILNVALSVGLTLISISLSRAFHPPAGAVAVTAAMSGDVGFTHGFLFVIVPVTVGMSLIVVVRALLARVTGDRYPRQLSCRRLRQG